MRLWKFSLILSPIVIGVIWIALAGSSCERKQALITGTNTRMDNVTTRSGQEVATFGSGCFWCSEAVFQNVKGVDKVESGYAGGQVKNPTYKEVCSGLTGHAEVIKVHYDPSQVSYDELLEGILENTRSHNAEPSGRRCRHTISFGYLLLQRHTEATR